MSFTINVALSLRTLFPFPFPQQVSSSRSREPLKATASARQRNGHSFAQSLVFGIHNARPTMSFCHSPSHDSQSPWMWYQRWRGWLISWQAWARRNQAAVELVQVFWLPTAQWDNYCYLRMVLYYSDARLRYHTSNAPRRWEPPLDNAAGWQQGRLLETPYLSTNLPTNLATRAKETGWLLAGCCD